MVQNGAQQVYRMAQFGKGLYNPRIGVSFRQMI